MDFANDPTTNGMVPNIKELQALFVDMDDTLVNYREAVLAGLNTVRERIPELHETDVDEMESDFRELLTQSLPRLYNKEISYRDDGRMRLGEVLRRHGWKSDEEEIIHYDNLFWTIFWKKRRLLHGAMNVLRLCSEFEIPIAIITNGNPQIQFRTMTRLKLHDYVDIVLTPESVDEMKPSNTLFERAMAIFDVNPERVIMVGDSFSHDVMGAVNAGIIPVWFNNSKKMKTQDVNAVEVASFKELLDKLQFNGGNK